MFIYLVNFGVVGEENIKEIRVQNLHTIRILRSLHIKEELKHVNP